MLCGSAPVDVPKLVDTVSSSFLFCVPERDRTNLVKAALEKLGSRLGYKVFVSDNGGRHERPEWLLDLVWWEPGRGTMLAVECEWGNAGDIMRDFEKLMATKAPLKLLVFRSRRAGAEKLDVLFRTNIEATLHALGTAMIDFSQHTEGETYVLMEHVEEDASFRAYEFHVPADGKLEVTFKDASTLFRPCIAESVSVA